MENNSAACACSLWTNLSIRSECEELYHFIESTERERQAAENTKIKEAEKVENTLTDIETSTSQKQEYQEQETEKQSVKEKNEGVNENINTSHMELVHSLQHQLESAHTQILELQSKLMKADVESQCATALQHVQEEKIHSLRCEVEEMKKCNKELETSKMKMEEEVYSVKSTVEDLRTHVESQLATVHDTFNTYFVVEWSQMEEEVKICKEQSILLVNVNTSLECKVQELQSKLLDYDKLHRDKIAAEVWNKELQTCLDNLTNRWETAQVYFDKCKVEVELFMNRVQNLENERNELQCTLEQSIATNDEWERKYFAKSNKINSFIEGNDESNISENEKNGQCITEELNCKTEENEEQQNMLNTERGTNEHNDALINALQCKIVDLALHLQDAQTKCTLAESVNQELQHLLYNQVHHIMSANNTIESEKENNFNQVSNTLSSLCKVNESLSAELMVYKSGLTSVMEVYEQLLEMYTDKTVHTYELEMQLAEQQIAMHSILDDTGKTK